MGPPQEGGNAGCARPGWPGAGALLGANGALSQKIFALCKKGEKKDPEIRRGMSFARGWFHGSWKKAHVLKICKTLCDLPFPTPSTESLWGWEQGGKRSGRWWFHYSCWNPWAPVQNLPDFAAFKEPPSGGVTACFISIASIWTDGKHSDFHVLLLIFWS